MSFRDIHPVGFDRREGSEKVSAVDGATKGAQQPCGEEARTDLAITQLVAELGARHLDPVTGQHPDLLAAGRRRCPDDPDAVRRQRRQQRGLVYGLNLDQNPSDARGDALPCVRGLAPEGQEDLGPRRCPRLEVTRRREVEVTAQAQMCRVAGLFQIREREVATGEGRGDHQPMHMVTPGIDMAGRQPGDLPGWQSEPTQRALDDVEPGVTVQPVSLGQRQRQMDDILRMPTRPRQLLEMRERRGHSAPGQRATEDLGVKHAAIDPPRMSQIIQHRPRPVVEGQDRAHQRSRPFRIRLIRRSICLAEARTGRSS